VASTFTTFTFTETVGAFGSVDGADESLAAVEVLFDAVDACCERTAPLRLITNRVVLTAREIVLERKEAGGMKIMINTMPELWHAQGKGL
jgi:hypothetical protein